MTHETLRPEIRWAVEAAQEKQAVDITVLKLRGTGAFAEYFLLCSGRASRRLQAIGEAIEERLDQHGRARGPSRRQVGAEWVLLDYGYFVVHIFSERARAILRSRTPLAHRRALTIFHAGKCLAICRRRFRERPELSQ